MANITFDELVELVDQLSSDDQIALMEHLQQRAKQRVLSVDEKMRLLRAVQLRIEVNQEPSIHREDWYDDEGC